MSLVVVGLSHHSSSVELREKLAFPAASIPAALRSFRERLDGAGVVILNTCNRVEVYANYAPASAEEIADEIRAFLCDSRGVPEAEFRDALYVHSGRNAAGHLFRVMSSIDSLVVGEAQILGQAHDAYLLSQSEQAADKVIHALFQKAFAVAKNIRSRTSIGEGKVSVVSVAVDLAVSVFQELAGKTVMVIGSGEMGGLALKHLMEHGAGRVLVVNRNEEKAQALAEPYGGEPIAFEALPKHLHRADIVISTTASPHAVLHPPEFRQALKERAQQPMLVIDIAVPRDVEPEVGGLDNVYLYNMDDLEQVVAENLSGRRKELDRCMALVEQGVEQFTSWTQALAAEPTLVSMTKELDLIREEELRKTLAALPDLTEKEQAEIAYLTKRILRKILSRSMAEIKHEIGHHDPHTVLHLVKRIFGLKEFTCERDHEIHETHEKL